MDAPSATRSDYVNTAQLDNMAQLMGELFVELIPAYLSESAIYIRQMPEAFSSGDMKTLERLAHSLKSSSRNVGAENFARIAEQLEKTARQGETAACPPLISEMTAVFSGVVAALQAYQAGRKV